MRGSMVTCEGCPRWGAVSWGRKDKVLYIDISVKWCEGWTACMHEGSTSYQTDTHARLGEGWIARVREGPISYQTNTGMVGGGGVSRLMKGSTVTCEGCTRWVAASCGRKEKALYIDISVKWCEGWTACMHEGSTSYQTDTGKARGRMFPFFWKVHGDERGLHPWGSSLMSKR